MKPRPATDAALIASVCVPRRPQLRRRLYEMAKATGSLSGATRRMAIVTKRLEETLEKGIAR